MTSLEMIDDIEDELSAAREAASRFLTECAEQGAAASCHHISRRRPESYQLSFIRPLVLLSTLVLNSRMFGNSDVEAVRLS